MLMEKRYYRAGRPERHHCHYAIGMARMEEARLASWRNFADSPEKEGHYCKKADKDAKHCWKEDLTRKRTHVISPPLYGPQIERHQASQGNGIGPLPGRCPCAAVAGRRLVSSLGEHGATRRSERPARNVATPGDSRTAVADRGAARGGLSSWNKRVR
jgi:hypothetical protein